MDPIKVDFTKDKKGKKNKEYVIPPEKARLKIVISLIITAVAGLIFYYFYLPPMNFKAIEMYYFFGAICLFYCLVSYFITAAFKTPDYVPYFKKRIRIPFVIIGIGAITLLVGLLASSTFFRAYDYSEIISVKNGNFTQDVEEADFSSVPRIDADTAGVLANRALSDLANEGLVSQFTVEPVYTQINYRNTPVRVVSLQYASIIKWFTNRSEGLPGYIIVDATTQKTDLKIVEGGIHYSTADHFGSYLMRHLRFNYPTYMFATPTFEIDDDGNPYWICARLDKTIGLIGGTDVIGAVLVNAVTGESVYYNIKQIRENTDTQWIDRVYSADLLVEQYNYFGRYRGGFWNSILGQKDTLTTTEGYNYLALKDDVYMYTGVTSLTSDQSLTGFTLINQRTKEALYYPISGAKEISAETSAEGLVQQYGYDASFPLLLNVNGVPTYFMSLKDNNSLVKMYAMINVGQYSIGAVGATLSECIDNYVAELAKNNIQIEVDTDDLDNDDDNPDATPGGEEQKPETISVSGSITDIRTAVIASESYYYIKLDSSDKYFRFKAADNAGVIILNAADNVTVTYIESNEKIVDGKTIK